MPYHIIFYLATFTKSYNRNVYLYNQNINKKFMKSPQSYNMDRFMLHLKNDDFTPKDASSLLRRSRDLCSDIDVTLRDTRVSKRHIEYDVSVQKDNINLIIKRLEPIGKLHNARHIVEVDNASDTDDTWKEQAIKEGIFYFNNERFWESHEVLEGVWKQCFEGERDLVQGIILVAAAFVHYQKNENRICISILKRAQTKLSNADGTYFGININQLQHKITEIISSGTVSSTFEI
jgi:predicted metal-dependent hydrolase